MTKYLLPLFVYLFSASALALAADDCTRAVPMVKDSVSVIVQAMRLHKQKASYQEIAQWRSKEFNPKISQIKSSNELTPKDMMNPELELTQLAYNDVLMRANIYVGQVYSHARGNSKKEQVEEQRLIIVDAVNQVYSGCGISKSK